LREGLAEYIAWSPRHATASNRRANVRTLLRSSARPTSIVLEGIADDASDRAVDAFYGHSHFAVDCLAARFGEKKLFAFVKAKLRDRESYDEASEQVFGTPFRPIDTACVARIRQQA
jgi:hypothetical protein